jgi:hypothetical protein
MACRSPFHHRDTESQRKRMDFGRASLTTFILCLLVNGYCL